jgi:hypothetical protein
LPRTIAIEFAFQTQKKISDFDLNPDLHRTKQNKKDKNGTKRNTDLNASNIFVVILAFSFFGLVVAGFSFFLGGLLVFGVSCVCWCFFLVFEEENSCMCGAHYVF